MNRRILIKNGLLGLAVAPFSRMLFSSPAQYQKNNTVAGLKQPVIVYNNWSSYDELSDNIQLTEELAMKELNEIVRLKNNGARFDYYVMDAFWFDKTGGYRVWQKQRWPNGPDKWLEACRKNDIRPGMWFSTNNLISSPRGNFLDLIPEWKDSMATRGNSLCLFRGNYLDHLSETLQMWADKGVKLFKFDFADFNAATADAEQQYLPSEIEELNKLAFIDALKKLRMKNPDIVLTGYNGFGGEFTDTVTPFRKSVDLRWLEVFDTLYCGDPRFSDVPAMNIWRSQDIYSDHMTRIYEMNGLPVRRIDNCGFMVGITGTCYKRGINAWKGMQILEFARGGWSNIFHGNLELFSDSDAKWFARTQKLFLELQQYCIHSTFGNLPGKAEPYGFIDTTMKGTVCTIVNPSQQFADIKLPVSGSSNAMVLYSDGGFRPQLQQNSITLGPEQLAVVGFNEYAHPDYDLGTDESLHVPVHIEKINVAFNDTGTNMITGSIIPPNKKDIRIILQQYGANGLPVRSWGGPPPDGKKMDHFLKIAATQKGRNIPTHIQYDKMIWSGLSWGVAEIRNSSLDQQKPLEIKCSSTEKEAVKLRAEVYAVSY